VSARHLENVRD
jgi:hypothetical protein